MLNMKIFQNGLQVPSCDQFSSLQPVYEKKQNKTIGYEYVLWVKVYTRGKNKL